jgi:hypothetical protein
MKRKHSFGYLLLIVFIVIIFIKLISGSLFAHAPDRLQFVVYGQDTKLYSLSHNGDNNYYIGYSPDLKVEVPNGYGSYRIGALSKLIAYEKKPELLSKAFSVATSSFVTYYFYPSKTEIYYADETPQTYRAPSFTELMMYKSNARLLDRIYLYLQVLQTSPSSFQNLDIGLLTKKVQQSIHLSSDAFGQEYKGFFYNRTYRTERFTVQIKYTNNYNTAVAIGKILEGSGVRVVDISEEKVKTKNCTIVTDTAVGSRTVVDLSAVFHCDVKRAKVDTSDILFILGSVEKEWEL